MPGRVGRDLRYGGTVRASGQREEVRGPACRAPVRCRGRSRGKRVRAPTAGPARTEDAPAGADTGGRSGGIRFIAESMRGHWRTQGLSIAAALVWTVAVSTIPFLVGRAVDDGLLVRRWTTLAVLGAVIAALGVVQGLASGVRRRCSGITSRRVEAQLRRRFLHRLLGLDVAYHDSVNRGQLLSRVTNDLFQIQAFVASGPAWIGNVVAVAAVAVLLVAVNPLLGAVALVMLPVVTITSVRYSQAVRPALGRLQRERGQLAGVVEETITGIRAVKGFGAEAALTGRLGERADGVRDEALSVVATRARFNPVLNLVTVLELVVINWLGGTLVLEHHLSVGTLLAFNSYLVILTGPLQSIGWFVVQLQRAMVSARRIEAIVELTATITDPAEAVPLPPGGGAVRFERVGFAYGTGDAVLDGLDLDIAPGETVALVGPTGSGKSTVAALVARLYDPTAGRVLLDGIDLRDLAVSDVRAAVGVVFDDNFLFDGSVADNLRVGRAGATDAELRAAARLAGADEFVIGLPDGYDTVVGERGLSLSGGQRQRLALARAILAEPRVLVLDDATSAVDAAKERQILAGIGALSGERTIVIVSHRAATIALADRVLLLDGGAVVASGTHEQLLACSARYRRVLGVDAASGGSFAEVAR
jgi:ATP-binding cassette subfamily B protein